MKFNKFHTGNLKFGHSNFLIKISNFPGEICLISLECKNRTKIARGIIFFPAKAEKFHTFQICKWENRGGTWGSPILYFVKSTEMKFSDFSNISN